MTPNVPQPPITTLAISNINTLVAIFENMPLAEMAASYNIQLADLRLLADRRPWKKIEDRQLIRTTLEKVIYCGTDALAMPRYTVSAEFVAMFIVALVAPFNRRTMCNFYDDLSMTADLAADQNRGATIGKIDPVQLHNIVLFLEAADPEALNLVVGQVLMDLDIQTTATEDTENA